MGRLVRKKIIKAKPAFEATLSAHHIQSFSLLIFIHKTISFRPCQGKNEKSRHFNSLSCRKASMARA
jgi:hypothetical protein